MKSALDNIVAKTYTEEEMDERIKNMKPIPISFIISPRSPSIDIRSEEEENE